MSKTVMRLLDRNLGLMECRVCGHRHFAGLGDGSHYLRGAWQCQNGCQLKDNRSELPDSSRAVPLNPVS
jgi:hypothetical protein